MEPATLIEENPVLKAADMLILNLNLKHINLTKALLYNNIITIANSCKHINHFRKIRHKIGKNLYLKKITLTTLDAYLTMLAPPYGR